MNLKKAVMILGRRICGLLYRKTRTRAGAGEFVNWSVAWIGDLRSREKGEGQG